MAWMEYVIVQDNPAYLAFCEDEGLEPWDGASEEDWTEHLNSAAWDALGDRERDGDER